MRAWRPGLAAGVALKRTFGLPLSFFGAALAHLGLGVTLLGLSGLGFGAETIATLHKGVPAQVGPYSVTLDSVGVANRKQSRSKYGAKRPKAAAK